MKKAWCLWATFLLPCLLWAQSDFPSLLPVKSNNSWGYVDTLGNWVVSPQFETASQAKFGLSLVQKNGFVGIMGPVGELLLPIEYDRLELISDSMVLYFEQQKAGIIHLPSQNRSRAEWDMLQPIHRFFVGIQGQSYGLISYDGRVVLPPRFDKISPMSGKRVLAQCDSGYQVVTNEGQVLFPASADSVRSLPNLNVAYRINNRWNIARRDGSKVLPQPADSIQIGRSLIVRLCLKDSCIGFSPFSNQIILDNSSSLSATNLRAMGNNRYLVQSEDKYGIMDQNGKMVVPTNYDKILRGIGGNYITWKNGKVGLLSTNGVLLYPPFLNHLKAINNNFYQAYQNGKTGLLSPTGEVLVPIEFVALSLQPTSAKAYLSKGGIRIYDIDEQGQFSEQQQYEQVKVLVLTGQQIDQPAMAIPTASSASAVNTTMKYAWFLDPENLKWGLRGLLEGDTVITARYDHVDEDARTQLALVSKNSDMDRPIKGLVDVRLGIEIVKPQYAKIFFREFRNTQQEVARFITLNKSFGMLNRKGEVVIEAAFIDQFKEGYARFNIEGKPRMEKVETRETLMKSHEYGVLMGNFKLPDNEFVRFQGGKWGYLNLKGEVVIAPQYRFVTHFQQARALGLSNKHWGMIDTSNQVLLDFQYAALDFIGPQKQYVHITSNSRVVGLVNKTGNFVLPQQFQAIGKVSEERIRVKNNDRWGIYDVAGTSILAPEFVRLGDYKNGLARARKGSRWGYLDSEGNWAIEPQFQKAFDFENGIALVRYKGKFGYLNPYGEWILSPKYIKAGPFFKGSAAANAGKGFGLIDQQGKWIVKPQFQALDFDLNGHFFKAVVGEQVLYLNPDGSPWNQFEFDNLETFKSSTGIYTIGRKKGLIDTNGQQLTPAIYRNILPYGKSEFAYVQNDTSRGFLDQQGHEVAIRSLEMVERIDHPRPGNALRQTARNLKMKSFYSCSPIKEGYQVVRNGQGQFQYIDSLGNIAFGQTFRYASDFNQGLAVARSQTGAGILNNKGMWVVPPSYPYIKSRNDGNFIPGTKFLYGLANLDGEVLAPVEYLYIQWIDQSIICFSKDGHYSYLHEAGSWIWKNES
ncbi:MAG: WG repeat-containing protein [Salibacteraceae bacterium]